MNVYMKRLLLILSGLFLLIGSSMCIAEQVGRRMLCIPLPTKKVETGGRRGAISNEELYAAIFPRGRPPILLPGTVVHTDSAKAYRNLGRQGEPAAGRLPGELAYELMDEGPHAWRWESQEEVDERAEAEKAEAATELVKLEDDPELDNAKRQQRRRKKEQQRLGMQLLQRQVAVMQIEQREKKLRER